MKYYNIEDGKIVLTTEGKEALQILGLKSLEELSKYPDEMLSENYWSGCKTFVDQALRNGKGVTWLDNVRIPFQSTDDKEQAHDNALGPVERFKTTKPIYEGGKQSGGFVDTFSEKGRFPANLLVEDNVLDDGKITKTNVCGIRKPSSEFGQNSNWNNHENKYSVINPINDCGGFSRYFDLDAWFSEAVKKLPKEVKATFPFLVVPKASKSERNRGCESLPEDKARAVMFTTANNTSGVVSKGFERFETLPKRNFHPTVKPLKLMSYLVTLGSRPNDLVLDPFCGSGTTCLASVLLNRCFIGIDNCLDYLTIADARLKGVLGDDLVCVNKHGELNYSFKQKKL